LWGGLLGLGISRGPRQDKKLSEPSSTKEKGKTGVYWLGLDGRRRKKIWLFLAEEKKKDGHKGQAIKKGKR